MVDKAPKVESPKVVGLVANLGQDQALAAIEKALKVLEGEKGLDLVIEDRLARRLGKEKGVPQSKMDVDMLVIAGGDGTILHALHMTNAPVLSINTGSVGFLAELGVDEIDRGLKLVLAGDYLLDERMRLKCTVNGRRQLDATNEVVVHTAAVSKMMTLELAIDGNYVDTVRADGLIVATPTGSTSYALSTGGPILDPRVKAMVLTPIAPFNLHSRPMVIPADSVAQISTTEQHYPGLVVIDGQHEVHFRQRTTVELTRSDMSAYFVRMGEGFYEKLRRKFISHYPCDVIED
ncbi:MAG: NAD(+)/NADH kinase [Thermoplasmata archaeon]|nr:NAD(+)/NADH kinase [Thermoplasmata archaeon]